MYRFYVSEQNISAEKIIITEPAQLHHLKDVLRLEINEPVIVFDNQGKQYNCLIKELCKNKITLEIKEKSLPQVKREKAKITIACAIPKKSKMDEIVDKLTQLGVDRIIPLKTERVIIKLDKKKELIRMSRWRKIALSASQQSQRCRQPVIEPITQIKELLSKSGDFDLKLIPTLIDSQKPLREVFGEFQPKNILVLIGPEGDFTRQELALAKQKGFFPVSLGNLVLRVETAAVAIVSFIRLYADN